MKSKKAICSAMLVLSIALLFCACQSVPSENVEHSYEIQDDIVYSTVDGTDLRLDLARPSSGKGPYPAHIFLYGGGFVSGSRKEVHGFLPLAAKRGYVAIAPEHRLLKAKITGLARPHVQGEVSGNFFPAQLHDVMCAVRWLRANAQVYDIDPERIGARGYSSGGYLALMLGLTDASDGWQVECNLSDYSSKVQAVVNRAGPIDWFNSGVSNYLGGTREEMPDAYEKANPYTHVSSDDAPILTIVGTMDFRVPYKSVVFFDAEMARVGASHTAKFFFGDHGNHHPNEITPMFEFFDEHLKKAD